jgi:hypothetical protein
LAGTQKSGASNEIYIAVNIPSPPSSPTALRGLAHGSTLALSWLNASGGGPPSGLLLAVTGAIGVTLPLPVSEGFSYFGVPPGTYTFSVAAFNSEDSSAPSNTVTLTFPGICPGAPDPPDGFSLTKNGNVLTAAWSPAPTGAAVTSYLLTVTGSFIGTIPTAGRSLSGAVGPGSYTVSVSAVNPCGTSAPATPVTVSVP